MNRYFILILLAINLFAQPTQNKSSSEILLEIKRLKQLGSVLYIAAHPDDENTRVLSYFSKNRLYKTGYLAMTRGDGGQNLVGSEKGDLVGVMRTQELLEARKIDGGEQYFTRAIDFGYTKEKDETFKFWNKEKILSDVVWVIRNFRPDVIITRFPGDGRGRHGQHTASALLAQEAFRLSADPTQFPDQLKYVDVWQTKRIFWDVFLFGGPNPKIDSTKTVAIDIGQYQPLLGQSSTEISALSRSMHKSQGFGASGSRGGSIAYFELTDGEFAQTDVMDQVNTNWNRVNNSSQIATLIDKIENDYQSANPALSVPALIALYKQLTGNHYWIQQKRKDVKSLILACSGLWLEAITSDYSAAPGSDIKIAFDLVNRSDIPIRLTEINLPFNSKRFNFSENLENNFPFKHQLDLKLKTDLESSQPYWLAENHDYGFFSVSDQNKIGQAEINSYYAEFTLNVLGEAITYQTDLLYRWTDRVKGELYRPFEIRPALTATINSNVIIFSEKREKEVIVTVKSNQEKSNGTVSLSVPNGWTFSPKTIAFEIKQKYGEQQVSFKLTAPNKTESTKIDAFIMSNSTRYDRSLIEISHDHIKKQSLFPPASAQVIKLDLKKVINKIGYIMGAGDEIPDNLTELGYSVTLLDDDFLTNGDLSQFDAIISGVRAYNTRERLGFDNDRLLDYVKEGGLLLVQFNVSFGLQTKTIGPYPFQISRDRVSVEDAPVEILNATHPVLNFPHQIVKSDFDGWIQERGLYFPNQWDEKYDALISSHDPDEDAKKGSIIYTKYGKGVFIYTGLSFFRQLPAGVSGAYRLFINLISAGKNGTN